MELFCLQHLPSRLWPHEYSIFRAALLKIPLHHSMLVLLLIYYVGLLLITLQSTLFAFPLLERHEVQNVLNNT